MFKKILASTLLVASLFTFSYSEAKSAVDTLTIIVVSPPSTSVTCALASSYTAPLAAGTTICPIVVSPTPWAGTLALSGPNASLFTLSGTNLVVAAAGITSPGSYSVTITATP